MAGKISGVYLITNIITWDRYIGSSKDMNIRCSKHFWYLRRNKHPNSFLQRSWNKYGEGAFGVSVLEYTELTREALVSREQYYIDTLRPEFNLSPTANSCLGVKHNEEARRHNADAKRGKILGPHSEEWNQNIGNANRGKKYSPEICQKMSETRKGKRTGIRHSEEARANMSMAKRIWWAKRKSERDISGGALIEKQVLPKGPRICSEETRRKRSLALMGHTVSDETRRKLSEANKGQGAGIPLSEETKQKLSKVNKGQKRSEEICNNIRMGAQNRKLPELFTEEHRLHLSEANLGKHSFPCKEETKRKISETLKGRGPSPETCKKISDTMKRIRREQCNIAIGA